MYIQRVLAISLLFHISSVSGDCKNRTLKLFDDQIQAIQKSVRAIVEDDSCNNNKKNPSTPVGFHAYMGSSKTFAKGVVWVYDKVVTNTHNAYSATTGKFITPKRGLYTFSYATLDQRGQMSHAGLYVNGVLKSRQACNNSGGNSVWLTCSNSAILLLQKGDVVYVAGHYGTSTTYGMYTDFSGAKLN